MTMLSVTELAERWHVNRKTVLNYIHKRGLPAIRTPGGNYRIWLQTVEEWEAPPAPEGEGGDGEHR